jgi:hypothetical protein
MPVKDPGRPRRRVLLWAGVAALNALTLAALWVTAWRIREEKLAARHGAGPPAAGGPEETRLRLLPGVPARFAHFTLLAAAEATLRVLDARGVPCADFTGLAPGQQRNWQELALAVVEAGPGGWLVEARLEPGAPCRGPGLYRKLAEGLRIELSGGRALVVLKWTLEEPALELAVESPAGTRTETFRGPGERVAAGIRIALGRDPSGAWALRAAEAP